MSNPKLTSVKGRILAVGEAHEISQRTVEVHYETLRRLNFPLSRLHPEFALEPPVWGKKPGESLLIPIADEEGIYFVNLYYPPTMDWK